MSDTLKPQSTSANEGTQIDLGDDLLQTRTIQREAKARVVEEQFSAPVDSIDELLVNSKILIGEGFLEEAKTTLRRILRMDPLNLTARDRLDEVQRIEIKRLLSAEENPRASMLRGKKKPEEESVESVLASLQHDLGPGVEPERQFFPKEGDLILFLEGVESLCAGASPQDRMDLGIGFLEMEFHEVAIHQFNAALRIDPSSRKARGLLAMAYLGNGQAFDAMIELESLVADQEAAAEEKIDYGYLAGKAQEMLGNFPMAIRWYRAVVEIEPGYRDANERLHFSLKKCAKIPS